MRLIKAVFKRKVSLRLNLLKKAPKQAPKPKSIRLGPKNRSGK